MPPLSMNRNFCSVGVVDSVTRMSVAINLPPTIAGKCTTNAGRVPAERDCKYIYNCARAGSVTRKIRGWLAGLNFLGRGCTIRGILPGDCKENPAV